MFTPARSWAARLMVFDPFDTSCPVHSMTLRTSLLLLALIAAPVALGVWKFGASSSEVRGSEPAVTTAGPSTPDGAAPASDGLVAATQSEPAVETSIEPEPEPAPPVVPAREPTPTEAVVANWRRPHGVTPQDFVPDTSRPLSVPDGEKLLIKAEEGGLDVDSLTEAEQEAYEKAREKRDQRDGR